MDNHTDEGALAGGLLGTGAGAIIGKACGNPLAGAAIGAVGGTALGAAIGNEEDKNDLRNRELIAQQLGRQVRAGAVTIQDVMAMTASGVNEDLIITHVRTHGMVAPLQTNDLIYLQQQGINSRVIAAMQAAPPPQPQAVIVQEASPPPVVVEAYPGYWGPYYRHPHYWHHGRW